MQGYDDTDYRSWWYQIRTNANYCKDNAINKPGFRNGQCTRCGKEGNHYVSCYECLWRDQQIDEMDKEFAKIIGGC